MSDYAMEEKPRRRGRSRRRAEYGHFLGTAHTRKSNLFIFPSQNNVTFKQWEEEGRQDAAAPAANPWEMIVIAATATTSATRTSISVNPLS